MVRKSRKKDKRIAWSSCIWVGLLLFLLWRRKSVFVLLYPFIPPQCVTPSKNATTFSKSHHTHTHTYIYIHTYIQSHAASISSDIYDPNHTSMELPLFTSHPYRTRHLVLFIIMYSASMIKGVCFLNIPSHPVLSCPQAKNCSWSYIRIICPWRSATCYLSTTFANWLGCSSMHTLLVALERTICTLHPNGRSCTRNKRRISTAVLCSRSALFCSVLLLCSILLYYTTCDCLWNGRFPDTTQGWYCFKQDALFFIKTPPVRVVLVYTCSCSPCCIADRFPFSSLLSGTSRLFFKMWASCRTAVVRLLLSP